MTCDACIKFTGRMYCGLNNLGGTCCTDTDTRPECSANYKNCSSQFGAYSASDKNYKPFLVCPYASTCGANPYPQNTTDPEYDSRFGENYIIARESPTAISQSGTIEKNQTCVYIIRKDFKK